MRRWPAALALALLLAALGLGLRAWRDPSSAVDLAMAAPAPTAASRPLPALPQLLAPAAASSGSFAAAAPPASAPVDAEFDGLIVPPSGLEACGMGRVMPADVQRWKANPAEGRAWLQAREEALNQRVRVALGQLAARLAAGNQRQQVVARLLMGDAEGAATLAEQSGDATAYGLALRRCGFAADGMACARLSAQHWAELDPSDARPVLRLLGEANRRKDGPAVEAALLQLGARPRLSRGFGLLHAEVLPLLDQLPDATVRISLQVSLVGMDAAMVGGEVSAASQACAVEKLQQPWRLQACRTVARQLLAATDNLMEALTAQKMAERSGVPPEQQAHDATTLKAAQQALTSQAMSNLGPDCTSLGRAAEFAGRIASEGELAAALSLLPTPPRR